MSIATKDHLAFAADLPLEEAAALYPRIAPFVGVVKVGLSLFVEHGPEAVRRFVEPGGRVFLDLKLHDIPNTVELAARRAGALGASFLTVHAQGGESMLKAAVSGAAEGAAKSGHQPPKILAVTVLTSLSDAELLATGHAQGSADTVLRLAELAVRAGVPGLVCSPQEAGILRKALGPKVFLCTPGIRPHGSAQGDQTRAETPTFAIRAGADLLVVGRPLYTASSPERVAQSLADEVSSA